MKYIKELDSLRAIAICSVLITHWFPADSVFRSVSSFIAGPNVFFTLSGFLITKILIGDRLKSEASGSSKLAVFKDFFIKRALRTLPAYYLIICIDYLFSDYPISDYVGYLTFTGNFYQYFNNTWGPLPHLWSMSVEQQFYLIWPVFVLFTPKRYLVHLIIAFICTGIISHQLFSLNHFSFVLPFACFDALGFGALLAWFVAFKPHLIEKWYPVLLISAILSIVFILSKPGFENLYYRHNRTMFAITVTWLISYFILQKGSNYYNISSLLNTPVLVIMGKISYGIYLYHLTIFTYSYLVFFKINRRLPLPGFIQNNYYLYVFENFVVVSIVAFLSWKYFEKPLTSFKSYLYNQSPETRRTLKA